MKKQKKSSLRLWPIVIAAACLLILVLIISVKIKPVVYNNTVNNDLKTAIDTTDWVTFTDESLGISFKHPADCFINGAGPGLSATNAVSCQNSIVEYQPLNYSYYNEDGKYYTNLDSKGIAELFYKTNFEDKSSNKPVNRYISKPEKINLGGLEAYQFSIEWGVEFPVGQSYTIDGRHKLTFLVSGDKKLFIDSNQELIAEEILKTFKFVDDNQATVNQNINEIAVNREELRYLDYGYYTDEKKIYYIHLEWNQAVAKKISTEEMANFNYFDENNRDLFIESTPQELEGADINSFVTLNTFCGMGNCLGVAKDKNFIYVGPVPDNTSDGRLNKADVKTFQYLKYNFYKDKNALYYYGMGWGRADYVDLATFEFIDAMYSKDKNNVYQFMDGFNIVKGANPKTFVAPKY